MKLAEYCLRVFLVALCIGLICGQAVEANRHRQGNARPPPWPLEAVAADGGAAADSGACFEFQDSCAVDGDCCTGVCTEDSCACETVGTACSIDADCCWGSRTRTCIAGLCAACIHTGEAGCSEQGDCCAPLVTCTVGVCTE
jgi:hypothetical protein